MKEVRTRFAPSPTGYMHIGNLRTALFAYLLAKKEGGSFILRIEDTDCDRQVEGAVDLIYKTLKLAGLNWNEGPDVGGNFGPYIQSQRKHIYLDYAKELIEKGHAYYCFCSKDRLIKIKNLQKLSKTPFKYDGFCRNLTKNQVTKKLEEGVPYVIRQKVPLTGNSEFVDEIFGKVVVDNSTLDDQILIKSDNMPTYNFANVVDDHLMNISHVIRGSEYLSSTPKYNLLYDAFGWEKPIYIHCAPVMKNATTKFSKRNGDATFEELIDKGFLPQAVINYVALLGWSPKNEEEIFSLKELERIFDFKSIVKSPAIFDFKKLLSINAIYLKNLTDEEFLKVSEKYLKQAVKRSDVDFKFLAQLMKTRVSALYELTEQLDFIDTLPEFDLNLFVNKKMKTNLDGSLQVLKAVLPVFQNLEEFNLTNIHDEVFNLIAKLGLKNGQVLWPIRTALSGKQFTPGGALELAVLLQKFESVNRIKKSVNRLELFLNK